ncbi:MAG: methyltransferase domain-containing protein [Pseudobacteriovorax sp.]|nr:methyltransferase domain-containing protein [Pseudobacteriovorax sp.]
MAVSFKGLLTPDDRVIDDLWQTIWATAAVAAAIRAGIIESLATHPTTAEELSHRLGLNPHSTESVLRVLVALGYVKQRTRRFYLTNVTKIYLNPKSELYRGYQLWEHFETDQFKFIVNRLKRKRIPKQTFGDAWKSGIGENTQAKAVARGMDAVIKASAISMSRSRAFSGIKKLLDVGGGSGTYVSAITEWEKSLEAVVLDLPSMCHQTKKFFRKRGSQRVSTHDADFFVDDWPSDCDGILFSNVLHDWPLKDVKKLLHRARTYINSNARDSSLFIHEALLDKSRNGPLMVTIFHLQMQMGFGGSQFTKEDLTRLLREAGFSKPTTAAKFGYYSLLKAKPI